MDSKRNHEDVITDTKIVEQFIREGLDEVATRETGWITLYKEKKANVFWETFYPYGESQGGGPVALRKVDEQFVREKYGIER